MIRNMKLIERITCIFDKLFINVSEIIVILL